MKDTFVVQMEPTQKDSRWSWVVCVCSFLIQFVSFGFHNSFGTYFVALLDKYGKTESQTAWVGSMAFGLTYICGPISIYICSHFSCRVAACTGSILAIISTFLASIVTDMRWMYAAFSLLNGLGSSLLYFSSLVVLIEYFNKHLSLANGIVLGGSGVGTLCINMISQSIISTYGLSTCYKVISGIYSICFFAGLAFAPTQEHYDNIAVADKKGDLRGHESFMTKLRKSIKIGEQWKNKGFIVWTGATAVVLFAYYIPSMYLISIAKSVGVPPAKGSLLIGFMAISHTVGKVVIGRLADHPRINRLTLLQGGLLVAAVINSLLPLAKSYESLVGYSFVQGFCDGCYGVMIGLVTHDIVGKSLMADAIGCLYFVVAVPIMLGAPVAGMVYDYVESYHPVFFLSSGLVCVGICLMFAVPWLVPVTTPQEDKEELELYDELSESFDDSEEHFDMSYVDEKKMANLFGKKKRHNLLQDMPSLRDSFASTRASSFVLFSIVSEDQHRDISAYTSRQELSLLSGTNTPIRGTPSTRRRHYSDVESRTSMYSLRQSAISVAQSEHHLGQDSSETEHAVVPFESALETVQEVAEVERKISCEEQSRFSQEIESSQTLEIVVEEIPSASDTKDNSSLLESQDTEDSSSLLDSQGDELQRHANSYETIASPENDRRMWNSSSSTSLKSSGTQLSEYTVDSGYGDEAWKSSSEIDASYTVQNFIDNEELCIDVIPRSMSCTNVSMSVHHPTLTTSTSQDYIDPNNYPNYFCTKHDQPLSACSSMDYIDCQKAEHCTKCNFCKNNQLTSSNPDYIDCDKVEECSCIYSKLDTGTALSITDTIGNTAKHSETNYNENVTHKTYEESPLKKLAPMIDIIPNIDSLPLPNMESTPNKDVSVECEYTDDLYSAEVERALELAEEVLDFVNCDTSKYGQMKAYRETVV